MAELPSGTVTFLFTDLEGSTRLWEEFPEAMRPALARHDEILRDAIEAHGGHVVKTTGDGAHAAFVDAVASVLAARDAQLVLRSQPWDSTGPLRVRMGIHTGRAEARAGDYYGTAVNRAARLMSAANGGQIVVSLTTEELVRDELPEGISLMELGEQRLRDLSRPERVFQVLAPGLDAIFAVLRSLDAFAGNLPVHLSSFVGREADMAEIAGALRRSRLVTLTGAGGVGKTRLATQVAADVLPGYPDGAWLCELGAASDPDAMVQVIASVLGVSQRAGMSLGGSIVEFLRNRDLLVLLDNCEHLLEASACLAEDVLSGCSGVQILATSREGLAVEGERVVPVRSLALPASDDIGEAVASDAVRLFVERAEAARPGFLLDGGNRAAVVEICRRLDGIPLAIELAAARVAAMSPAEVARRLDERFRLLTGGRRTAVERHHTLRATVDWSYSLLSDTERAVFGRLGVFAGGFEASAAEAIVAGGGVDGWDVLDTLGSLVAKSMVTVDEGVAGTTRYELLETMRAYATAQLDDAGESDRWRRHHAEHCARFAEDAAVGLTGPDERNWRERFHTELDNLRAAVTWSLDSEEPDDGELAMRIVAALAAESLADRVAGVGAWAELAQARATVSTPARRSAVLAAVACKAFLAGEHDVARARASEAARDDQGADCAVPSFPFTVLGCVAIQSGNSAEGLEAVRRGYAVVESEHRLYDEAQLLACAASARSFADEDHSAARADAEHALRLARQLGNPTMLAITLGTLGVAAWRDDPDIAIDALNEAIDRTHAGAGDATFVNSLALVAPLRARRRDFGGALDALREALEWGSGNGDFLAVALAVGCAIEVVAALGAAEDAAVLAGMMGDGPLSTILLAGDPHRPDRERVLEHLRADLGDETFGRSAEVGAAMSQDQAVDRTVALLARLRQELGDR